MSAESRSGKRTLSLFDPDPGFCIRRPAACLLQKSARAVIASTAVACAPPKLNNRSGPPSDESIQGEGVKTGCVDTIVNDVSVFLNKYENGESHRWN